MKTMKDAAKDIIIAGLGTVDQQNEEIKDLLRRGSEVFGFGEVDNEELTYNGNREILRAKREAKEREDHTYDFGHGVTVSYIRDRKEGDNDGQA